MSRKSYTEHLNLHTGAGHTDVIADLLPLGTEHSIHVLSAALGGEDVLLASFLFRSDKRMFCVEPEDHVRF